MALVRLFQSRIGRFVREGGLLGVGIVDREAAQLIVLAGRPGRCAGVGVGVVQISEVVGREVWIEGDAEQAALAGRIHVQMERGEGRSVVVNQFDVPALFKNEQAPIGREFHRRGTIEAGCDQRLGESAEQVRRRRSLFQLFDCEAEAMGRSQPRLSKHEMPPRIESSGRLSWLIDIVTQRTVGRLGQIRRKGGKREGELN